MHLTNTSVNKKRLEYKNNMSSDEDGYGSKWSLNAFKIYLMERNVNWHLIWQQVTLTQIKIES